MKERNTNQEVYRVAEGLSRIFVNRWDLYGKQMDDGRYICVHKPLFVNHVVSHLQGKITLGTYLLDQENNARFVVLDADDDESFEKIKSIPSEIPSYLEESRRGGHLWMFFKNQIEGEKAKNFGIGVSNKFGADVEVFPKQGMSEGPGSLVRLPFGIHRKSNERYGFIKPDGNRLGTWKEQLQILISPQTIPNEVVNELTEKHQPAERKVSSDKWASVRSIPITEFISQFIELKGTGTGAVGLCPFHDDKHSSFGVNESGNYWHCFAGCGGGSVIDFWMKYRCYDFKTAVSDLENILGGSNERENLHNPGSGKIFEALKEQSLSTGSERENTIYPNRKERKDSGGRS